MLSCVKKVGKQEVAVFEQTTANFGQRKLWVPHNFDFAFRPNFPKMWFFEPHVLHFWTQIFRHEEDYPTSQNLGEGAMTSLSQCRCVYVCVF